MSGCLVAIGGGTCSGTSSLRCYLLNNNRAVALGTRDPLEKRASEYNLPTDSAGLQKTYVKLAEQYGENVIWQLFRKDGIRKPEEAVGTPLQLCSEPILIVESLRLHLDFEESKRLAEELDRELLLVYLYADEEERRRRYDSRGRDSAEPISDEKWAALESDRTAAELDLLMAAIEESDCGMVIDTTMTPAEKVGERVLNAMPAAVTDPAD